MMLKKRILAMALAGGLVLGGVASADAASLMSVKTLSLKLYELPILADKAVATTCYGKGDNTVSNYEAYVKLVVTSTDGKEAYKKAITRTGWDAVSGKERMGFVSYLLATIKSNRRIALIWERKINPVHHGMKALIRAHGDHKDKTLQLIEKSQYVVKLALFHENRLQ